MDAYHPQTFIAAESVAQLRVLDQPDAVREARGGYEPVCACAFSLCIPAPARSRSASYVDAEAIEFRVLVRTP